MADTSYSAVQIGDFDGSGHDEVAWENPATGRTGYWTTGAGGAVDGFKELGIADTSYHPIPH